MAGGKGIVINISGSGEGAAEALRQIEAKMRETAETGKEAGASMAESMRGFQESITLIRDTFVLDRAFEAIKGMIEKSMELGVELKHMSEQTGISAENLSVLRYVSETTDVSFETLSKGFKKLSTTIFEMHEGTKLAKDSFAALGLSEQQVDAVGNDMYGVMALVADKFKEMPDGIQKNAIATQLFGRAGQELIPVLNQGAAGIEEYRAKAQSLGIVLDEQGVEKMETLHKSLVDVKASFEGAALSITGAMAPALEKLATLLPQVLGVGGQGAHGNDFAAGLTAIDDWADTWVHAMARVGYAMAQFASNDSLPSFQTVFPGKYGSMQPGSIGGTASNLAQWLRTHKSHGGGGEGGSDSGSGELQEQDRAMASILAKWEQTYHLTAGIVQHMHEMRADAQELDKIEGNDAWAKLQSDAQAKIDSQFKAKPANVTLGQDEDELNGNNNLGAVKRQIISAEEMAAESSRVIGGFIDQLSQQAISGKMNFKSLVDSALADLERFAMGILERQWLLPMMNAMFGAGMGTNSAGMSTFNGAPVSSYAMANGGHIGDGGWAIVGDTPGGDMSNAELFAPDGPGTVLPHDVLAGIASAKGGGGSGAPNVSVNVVNNSSAQVSASPAGVTYDSQARQFVIQAVLEDMNQGGPLAGAMSGFSRG